MGYAKVSRTFVYGDFFFSKKRTVLPPPGGQPFAIEILREFSTTELIGKLYLRAGGSWVIATRDGLTNFEWYKLYRMKVPPRFIFFAMEGSGTWHVQNIRDESDDSGPYIAVALKFGEPTA
jgi:hypothetical protein